MRPDGGLSSNGVISVLSIRTDSFPADAESQLTSLQQDLHHLHVSCLSGERQWSEAVVAAGTYCGPGVQQQGHQCCSARPRGLMKGPAAVAAPLVHPGAAQEQQLHQVHVV